MKNTVISFFAFLLLAALQVQAQDRKDKETEFRELQQKIADKNLSDYNTYIEYENHMRHYYNVDVERTYFYYKIALAFVKEKKNIEWQSMLLSRMANVYTELGKRDSASLLFDNALELIEGKDYYRAEYLNYHLRGFNFGYSNEFDKALNSFLKAMELNEKDKAKNISEQKSIDINILQETHTFMAISWIYYEMFNKDKTIEYLVRILKIIEENPNVDYTDIEFRVWGNLAEVYMDTGRYEEAFPILMQYYETSVARNDIFSTVQSAGQLASYYLIKGNDYQQALKYAKKAEEVAEKSNMPYLVNIAERSLMDIYLKIKDFKKALYHAENALSRTEEDDIENLEHLYGVFIRVYALLGDADNSDKYLTLYRNLMTKISDKNMHDALQDMEVKYDVAQKDLDLERQKAEIDRQRSRQYIYIGGLMAAGLLVVLLIYIVGLRNKRNRALVETNTTKDKFFSIISHDLKNPAVAQRDGLQHLADNAGK